MTEIKVKYDNYFIDLDLDPNVLFEINFSINRIKDISNSDGAFTKSIVMPDTPTNRKVFGYASDLASDVSYNVNFKQKYNPNKKVKCFVIQNGITVLEGFIQLTRYSINEHDKYIETVIYADNTSFYQAMGDKLLTDIDFSEFNFKFNLNAITQSWTNDPFSYSKGYHFPLIDYGYNWTLNDLEGYTSKGSYGLSFQHFKPAVYVKTIWDKVFKSNGFNYISNFLGSNVYNKGVTAGIADPRFGSLIVPFANPNFQTDNMITQDKIFFVGLSQSTLSQNTTYDISPYYAKTIATGASYAIVNAFAAPGNPIGPTTKKLWYNGYMLSPFDNEPFRTLFKNKANNETRDTYVFHSTTIPFRKDVNPLYNTTVGSASTYDMTNDWYQNLSGQLFKQRFVLKTDILTAYSLQYNSENSVPNTASPVTVNSQSYRYVIKVEFFRERNPTTGAIDSTWASGEGYRIPGDFGDAIALGITGGPGAVKDLNGNPEKISHWVADINGNSNCFTKERKLIVPQGPNRYLGTFCTNPTGTSASEATGDGGSRFRFNSGDAVSWYYNDAYNQVDPDSPSTPSTQLQGLWVSGISDTTTDPYFREYQATWQPGYGDFYQNLQIQTIFLDGDDYNPLYGNSGSILPNANRPILPGEKVRVKVTFGAKYAGQRVQESDPAESKYWSYKPPSCMYLLTATDLANYDNGTEENPKTVFFNDVSPDYVAGMTISFTDIVPKNMKQRDFIQDVIRMHNLYLEPAKLNDYPNTLIIEPRDDYYRLSSDVLDWTSKLDISQPIDVKLLAETQNKRTIFTYKKDSDYYNKQYEQNTSETYGQYIYSIDNDFLSGELKMELGFSPTPITSLYRISSSGDPLLRTGGIILPVFTNESSSNSSSNNGNSIRNVNARILYRKYIKSQNGDKIFMFNGLTDTYPYAGHYDDPYQPAYSTLFGQTKGEFYPVATDQFFNNLFNNYWTSLLSELNDLDSRFITCQMFLTPKDINEFYFYKQILLNIDGVDGYYKVNSIEGYIPGQSGVCTVTLLRSNSNLPRKIYQGSTNTPRSTSIYIVRGGGALIPTSGGAPSS